MQPTTTPERLSPFTPFICAQTVQSRASSIVCAYCTKPAAGCSAQLALGLGLTTRRALRMRGSAAIPTACRLTKEEEVAILWCDTCDGHGGAICLDAYCTHACRVAARTCGHALLCEAGLAEGSPLREFHRLARSQHEEAIGMGAMLIASALAKVATFTSSCADLALVASQAEHHAEELEVTTDPSGRCAAVMGGAVEDGGTAVDVIDQIVAEDPSTERSTGRARDRSWQLAQLEASEWYGAVEEAASMLRFGLLERVDERVRAGADRLLSVGLFVRLCTALRRHLLPLEVVSPLVRFCRELGRPPLGHAGESAATLGTTQALAARGLLYALREQRRRAVQTGARGKLGGARAPSARRGQTAPAAVAPSAAMAVGSAAEQLDACLLAEAEAEVAEAEAEAAEAEAELEAELEATEAELVAVGSTARVDRTESAILGTVTAGATKSFEKFGGRGQPTADAQGAGGWARDRVTRQRRLCLLAQCAPRLFPSTALVLYDPHAARLAHSCLPSMQVQPVATCAAEAGRTGGGGTRGSAHHSGPETSEQGLRVAFVTIRKPLLADPACAERQRMPAGSSLDMSGSAAEEEPATLAWVDVAAADVTARGAMLRRRFGASFRCECERCAYERLEHRQALPPILVDYGPGHTQAACTQLALARDAMEDGRHAEATALLRRLVRAGGATQRVSESEGCAGDVWLGDAWHLLGMSLLNLGQWTEAHEAWRDGAQLAPTHALLCQQAAKDAHYAKQAAHYEAVTCAAEGEAGAAAVAPAGAMIEAEATRRAAALPTREVLTLPTCEVLTLPDGARVVSTRTPLFSAAECAEAIAYGEAHAHASGGWTTTRHHAVPTTDLPVHGVPALLEWFVGALRGRLAPMLAEHFAVDACAVRVHDAFLVKYDAAAQAHLPLHVDESELSLTIVLNETFVGGGTFFAGLRTALSPGVGHVIAFDGHALHGGEPIVHGTRYIIAAFLFVQRQPVQAAPSKCILGALPAAKRARGGLEPEEDTAASFSFNF